MEARYGAIVRAGVVHWRRVDRVVLRDRERDVVVARIVDAVTKVLRLHMSVAPEDATRASRRRRTFTRTREKRSDCCT
jgi:hypothetical protein